MTANLLTLISMLLVFCLNAWAIIGINRATEYEEVGSVIYNKSGFWFVRYYSIKFFGEFLSKTICTCSKCMATLHSIWGFAIFYFLFADSKLWLIAYPLYWFALSGVAHAISLKVGKMENE